RSEHGAGNRRARVDAWRQARRDAAGGGGVDGDDGPGLLGLVWAVFAGLGVAALTGPGLAGEVGHASRGLGQLLASKGAAVLIRAGILQDQDLTGGDFKDDLGPVALVLDAGEQGAVAALAGPGEQGAEFGHAALERAAGVADCGGRLRRSRRGRGVGLRWLGRLGRLGGRRTGAVRRGSSNRARREQRSGTPGKDDALSVRAHDPPENTTAKVTSEACSAPGVVGKRQPLILATVQVCTPGS